ncbi:MAG: hypothetical protein MUP16_00110, partial [Sedimentisphaerales bacterium]|nr:hypothetical protein [Sedimentisphaerales bacterium]
PNLLWVEQYCGIYIKRDAVKNAFIILDKSKVDNNALKYLQDALRQELDRDAYIPGCQAEKLYQFDKLQRMFIDNGRGTGRLWWRMGFGIVIPLAGEGEYYERKIKMSCFTGPTRNQIIEQIEQTSALFYRVIVKTPWQIKNGGHNYFEEIDNICNRHFSLKVLDIGFIYPFNISNTFYETRAKTEALIAVLAILRFKADNYRLPVTLDELVALGYLKSIPIDPYSDGPLIYKRTGDNFALYSVGEDFEDDGGLAPASFTSTSLRQSVTPNASRGDIVFWPVKCFEKYINESKDANAAPAEQ